MTSTFPAANTLGSVTLVRFHLVLTSPGGITVPGSNRRDEVDAVLDTDHYGLPHIPATSLAGALRQAYRTQLNDRRADAVFGHLLPKGTGGDDDVDAVASRLWVLGSRLANQAGEPLRPDAPVDVSTRVATAIDRRRGAARNHTLRSEQMLLAGARLEAYLRWENASDADRDELLRVISAWRPLIGRGVTRGRGSCAVQDLRWGRLELNTPEDLLTWATVGGPDLFRKVAIQRPPPRPDGQPYDAIPRPWVLDVGGELAGPLLVGTGDSATEERADGGTHQVAQPLYESGKHLIPGSALKGVLRSRCEYVLRTVAPNGQAEQYACLDQKCGDCFPCSVFGHGGRRFVGGSSVGQRAQLRVLDAPLENTITRERHHVAIDRFTGGAADELLYSDNVIEAGTFRIQIQDLGVPDANRDLLSALLRLALADLDDGLIGIGRSTTRGYGTVKIDLGAAETAQERPLPTVRRAQEVLAEYVASNTPHGQVEE